MKLIIMCLLSTFVNQMRQKEIHQTVRHFIIMDRVMMERHQKRKKSIKKCRRLLR